MRKKPIESGKAFAIDSDGTNIHDDLQNSDEFAYLFDYKLNYNCDRAKYLNSLCEMERRCFSASNLETLILYNLFAEDYNNEEIRQAVIILLKNVWRENIEVKETIIKYKRFCPYCGNEGLIGWKHCDGFYGCKNLVTCSKCNKEYVVVEPFVEGYPIFGLEWLKRDPRVESITTKEVKEVKNRRIYVLFIGLFGKN